MQNMQGSLLFYRHAPYGVMAYAVAESHSVAAKPVAETASHVRGCANPHDCNISYLLARATIANLNRSITIEQTTNKGRAVFVGDGRPRRRQALGRRQPKTAKEVGHAWISKYDSPCSPSVLWANAIGLTNEQSDLLHQIAVFGANLNAVSVETSVAPDKTSQPGQVVRPRCKELSVERVAEYRLCQASGGTSPELCPPTHWLAIGNLRCAHTSIISYHWCQRCHLNYDRDEHIANAAATRRRRRIDAGQAELEL